MFFRRTLFSFLIIAIITFVLLFLFGRNNQNIGGGIFLASIFIWSSRIATAAAIAWITLYILRFSKLKSSFALAFTIALNISIVVIGGLIYFTNEIPAHNIRFVFFNVGILACIGILSLAQNLRHKTA